MARTGGYGAKDDDGNFYFKAMGDGEFLLGNSFDDSVSITGSLGVNVADGQSIMYQLSGSDAFETQIKSTDVYLKGKQQDIDVNFGVNSGGTDKTVLTLDATNAMMNVTKRLSYQSVTYDLGTGTTSTITPTASLHLLTALNITGTMGMHIVTLASGDKMGQILQLVMNTTTNGLPLFFDTANLLGTWSSGVAIPPNSVGGVITFYWNGSAWAVMSTNNLASAY